MAKSWQSAVTRCHCCDNWGESKTILGGRLVRICDACANKLHASLTAHRFYKEYIRHAAHRVYLDGLAASGCQVSEEDWLNHFEKDRTIKAELFHVTGLWLEEHKRTEEEREPETNQATVAESSSLI